MQLARWQQDDRVLGKSGGEAEKRRCSAQAPSRADMPNEPTRAEVRAEVERLSQHAYAKNTRRAYQSDWEAFSRWWSAYGELSMPATVETLRSCAFRSTWAAVPA